jgi:hypothetical protein
MIAEHVDVGLNPLVIVLYLTLCLWVVGCQEALINIQGLEEALSIISSEHCPPICIVYSGCAMMLPHMLEVELDQVLSCGLHVGGNEMCHFCQSIHDDIDGIMPSQKRETYDVVQLCPFPWPFRHQEWFHNPRSLPVFVLVPSTCVAPFYVVLDILSHALPPIGSLYQLKCTLLTKVAGYG